MTALIRSTLLIWLVLLGPFAVAADQPIQIASADTRGLLPSPEALIAKTLEDIRASRLDTALKEVDKAIAIRPDFKLAHLIKGDLLMARAKPLATLGAAPAAPAQSLSDFRDEARMRLLRYIDQPSPDLLPKHLLKMSADQKYALLADGERARLYVFENVDGEPRLLRDYYMSIGRNGVDKRVEGDKKTPLGVYFVTGSLPRSQLTDFYGAGAFPINYPNEWDQLHGRSGHGIWLHGTPSNTYSRPPRASDGCLVVPNPDLAEIGQWLRLGTPIIIADRIEWLDRATWNQLRQDIVAKLESWKSDWENRESERFLTHYSASFFKNEGQGWVESKRRNIDNKDWIRVGLSDMSFYFYPGGDMAVATFDQDYSSDKFKSMNRKRLYLRLEGGQWRIVLEKSFDSDKRLAAQTK